MIILIPLGGTGQRFKKNGYSIPKALIKVDDKEIIFHLLDNLQINKNISMIYIPYNKEYVNYNFEQLLTEKYPNYLFKFFILEKQTRGACETIYNGLKNIETMKDQPVLCIDSDNFYTINIINLWNGKNTVFSFIDKGKQPLFSYVKTNNNKIIDIVEKNKISDYACTGAYGFNSFYKLMNECEYIINNNITQKGEFYTSGAIKEMLKKNSFTNIVIDNKDYFSLGTPEQIEIFTKGFLFDLDGTLVNSDHIYTDVWNTILKQYNITCNKDFFDTFIKGKSDAIFLKYLIKNISSSEINKISELKDTLFIEKLTISNSEILLPGVLSFFNKLQNGKVAIVTSCNKTSAKYILKHTGLDKYVNTLITANDVQNHKPHPEPYQRAMKILKRKKENCIIFEDSYSGYCSALNSNVKKIILIINDESSNEIINAEQIKITNYNEIKLSSVIENNNIVQIDENLIYIKHVLDNLPIKSVKPDNTILKAGYICNINLYNITYNDNKKENVVLKISNLDNELSKTALELNLYKNELYFYDKISSWINVKIPKYYGSFIVNNQEGILMDNQEGILMEDLNKHQGTFNINLNKNIQMLLKLVYHVFKMHNKYYFENENSVIKSMKPLSKINQISYYKTLVTKRFDTFIKKNRVLLTEKEIDTFKTIHSNFDNILNQASEFPLSFCHGDLKSPNIFYKNDTEPYFLDWQYIHLNKGVSDIVFLLVESVDFDKNIIDIVVKYYYTLIKETREISYETYMKDFKNALCIFPFFVCIWFNSENSDKLLDPVFPVKFMKNLLKYYDYYL